MEKVKNYFWFCSGASPAILKRCPSETSKYFGIGGTILFTGIFASLAGGYALYTVFNSLFWAILFALIWGAMIFNLDRFIVSSMRKREGSLHEFLMAIPRIILAVIIAMVIATPMELKIFEQEIETEMRIMEEEYLQRRITQIDDRYSLEIEMKTASIAELKTEIITKEKFRNELDQLAQKEADGTGGTMKRNAGPIYKIKKQDADKAQVELEALKTINDAEIASIGTELKNVENDKKGELQALEKTIFSGFAYRLEALDRLGTQNKTIALANWFILLLFIAIETAPVIVKLISPKGPYDEILEGHEHAFRNHRIETVAQRNHLTQRRLSAMDA